MLPFPHYRRDVRVGVVVRVIADRIDVGVSQVLRPRIMHVVCGDGEVASLRKGTNEHQLKVARAPICRQVIGGICLGVRYAIKQLEIGGVEVTVVACAATANLERDLIR